MGGTRERPRVGKPPMGMGGTEPCSTRPRAWGDPHSTDLSCRERLPPLMPKESEEMCPSGSHLTPTLTWRALTMMQLLLAPGFSMGLGSESPLAAGGTVLASLPGGSIPEAAPALDPDDAAVTLAGGETGMEAEDTETCVTTYSA